MPQPFVPQSQEPDLQEENASPLFWRRLARAAMLVAAGAAAHQYLLPTHPPARTARSPIIDTARALPLEPARPDEPSLVAATSIAAPAPPGVSQEPPAGNVPIARAAEPRIVPTSGVINMRRRVRSSAPAARRHGAAAGPEERAPDGERHAGLRPAPAGGAVLPAIELLPPRQAVAGMPRLEPAVAPTSPHAAANAPATGDDETRAAAAGVPEREAAARVRQVLQQYRAAYERLDVAAARSIWPSVDHVALAHAFRQLSRQRLTFDSCGISVSGASALARCHGTAEYVPKVGGNRALLATGEWVFDLARHEADWKIVSASVR